MIWYLLTETGFGSTAFIIGAIVATLFTIRKGYK